MSQTTFVSPVVGVNKVSQQVKTPLQQFIEHAEGTLKWLEGDSRKAVENAIQRAKQLLPVEKSHICEAFRNGVEGVKWQTGQQYYRETYGDLHGG